MRKLCKKLGFSEAPLEGESSIVRVTLRLQDGPRTAIPGSGYEVVRVTETPENLLKPSPGPGANQAIAAGAVSFSSLSR